MITPFDPPSIDDTNQLYRSLNQSGSLFGDHNDYFKSQVVHLFMITNGHIGSLSD